MQPTGLQRGGNALPGCFKNSTSGDFRIFPVFSLAELKRFHPAFEQDVFDDLSMIACVEKRRIPGAPAPDMVQKAIESARKKLAE